MNELKIFTIKIKKIYSNESKSLSLMSLNFNKLDN
jgi:hypothetical protein